MCANGAGGDFDFFVGFENLEGSGFDDLLTGDDDANILMGLGAMGMMIFTAPILALSVLGAVPLIAIPMTLLGRRVSLGRRASLG